MVKNEMRPVHPGEILREEYLLPLEMSVNSLAHQLRVPATRLQEIVKERRAITTDPAIRWHSTLEVMHMVCGPT